MDPTQRLSKIAAELDEAGEYHLADEIEGVLEQLITTAAKKEKEKEKAKKKPDQKAKGKGRSDCVFPADHPKVKDNKEHFPLGSEKQSVNALARASQYAKVPSWYSGSLESLVRAIRAKVREKFPGIKLTDKSKNPGKG